MKKALFLASLVAVLGFIPVGCVSVKNDEPDTVTSRTTTTTVDPVLAPSASVSRTTTTTY